MCRRKWWNVIFFLFFPNNSLNGQLCFRIKVLTIWSDILAIRGSYSQPQITWDNVLFLFLRFCTFFKIFYVRLGKKRKNVSFSRVYVCVKAKLTLVSYFSPFFFAPSPNIRGRESGLSPSTIAHQLECTFTSKTTSDSPK